MSRFWIKGIAIVAAIAALITLLIVQFLMPSAWTDLTQLSALFALIFALTATLAHVCLRLLRNFNGR